MAKSDVLEAPPKKERTPLELKEGNVTFQLLQQVTPRIKGEPPFPAKLELPARVLSYDPESGQNRMIRFIDGIASYWLDEQKDIKEEQAKTQEWFPTFVKGVLVLRYPEDEAKIKCLFDRDDFDGKTRRVSQRPPAFTLVNKEAEFENKLNFIEARHKAEGIAMNAHYEDLIQHAIYLNISLLDGLRNKEEAEIREEYVNKASNDPKLFLETYDSPVMKVASTIKQALNKGLIDLTHVQGEARYADSKALITALDPKEETLKQLTDFALSKNGDGFRKKISDALKKA